MRRRATFTALVALPDEYGADELEVIATKLIAFFASGEMATMNVTWSAPGIGRKTQPSPPVLVFKSDPKVPKDELHFINHDGSLAGKIVGLKVEEE